METTINRSDLEQLLDDLDVMFDDGDELDSGYGSGDYLTTSYSGRGMYGATCIGIVTSDPNSLLVRLGLELGDRRADDDGSYWDDLAEHFTRPQTDSMGLATIVYWPGLDVFDDYKHPTADIYRVPVSQVDALRAAHVSNYMGDSGDLANTFGDEPRHDLRETV